MATKAAAGKPRKAPAKKAAKPAAAKPSTRSQGPDVVYVVRPGDDNEELRYSLRSVAKNAPHRDVWIVGTVPSWTQNVRGIPLAPVDEKFANQRQSLAAAASEAGISDPFVLFNDDMFVMEPIAEWRTWNLDTIEEVWGGPIGGVIAENTWLSAVWHTYRWMGTQGHPNPLYYENHTPLLFDKKKLAKVLAEYPADEPLAINGTYAITGAGGEGEWGGNAKLNYAGLPEDVPKVDLGMPYLSTDDSTFRDGPLGTYIRSQFPEPCLYERT